LIQAFEFTHELAWNVIKDYFDYQGSNLITGSRAKGNYRKGSDIDLSLVAPTVGVSDLLKIENEIEELLLPYKVDLSLFHLIENKELVDHIKRIGKKF